MKLAALALLPLLLQVSPNVNPTGLNPGVSSAVNGQAVADSLISASLADRENQLRNQKAQVSIKLVSGADNAPVFATTPNMLDVTSLYPQAARGRSGTAVIQCVSPVTGGVRSCAVASESPSGRGFGEAGRALAQGFVLTPATKAGAPVESTVQFTIAFPGLEGQSRDATSVARRETVTSRVATRVAWREAPSYDQMLAVYPERAKAEKAGGRAVLTCAVGDAGRVTRCTIASESPVGKKFGESAQRLATLFVMAPTFPDGSSTKGSSVQIPVTFNPAMLDRRDVIGQPQWERMPSAAGLNSVFPAQAKAEGISKARAVVECRISATGNLEACKVTAEEPAGYGFGQAALQAAPRFVAPRWSEEGLPAVGATIRLPIAYDLTAGSQTVSR